MFRKDAKEAGHGFASEEVNWGPEMIKHGKETYFTLCNILYNSISCVNQIF